MVKKKKDSGKWILLLTVVILISSIGLNFSAILKVEDLKKQVAWEKRMNQFVGTSLAKKMEDMTALEKQYREMRDYSWKLEAKLERCKRGTSQRK